MAAKGPPGVSVIQRKIATFVRLPSFVLLWLPQATMTMAIASLTIGCVPFRRLTHGFRRDVGEMVFDHSAESERSERALLIRQIIDTVSGNVPFRWDFFRRPWWRSCSAACTDCRMLFTLW